MGELNPEIVPVQQEVTAPEPPKRKKPGFLAGLVTGAALTAIIGVFVFAAVWPLVNGTASTTLNTMISAVPEGEVVLNRVTRRKVELINAFILERYYKDDTEVQEKRDAVYRGLIASLGDPYSTYFNEEEFNELQQQNEGIYYGIGAYVKFNEELNRSYVSGVIRNSPAEEAGLQADDVFWTVDGESTEGLKTDEVAAMIRGPENTQVEIVVLRDGEEMVFEITRRKVEHQTVEAKMLENEIGYLQITEFDGVTPDQFQTAYEELQNEGMRGLVLDLRGNPGGNLAAVCDIAKLMLPEGDIVYTVDKYGVKENYTCDGKNEIQIPLAVLVDGNSASAAEILAGAIKDYEKGTLVGTTTYGKGIVQRFFPLGDGSAIKLTISDYYTPKGNNIHKLGIEPDEIIEFDGDAYKEDGTDNQLDRAVEIVLSELQ